MPCHQLGTTNFKKLYLPILLDEFVPQEIETILWKFVFFFPGVWIYLNVCSGSEQPWHQQNMNRNKIHGKFFQTFFFWFSFIFRQFYTSGTQMWKRYNMTNLSNDPKYKEKQDCLLNKILCPDQLLKRRCRCQNRSKIKHSHPAYNKSKLKYISFRFWR